MLNWLLIFLPIAVYLEFTHAPGTWIFIAAALAILPLAGLMGRATEELATKTGSAVGGLLNATFGNATELIIAFFALQAGKLEVVKASITGSILGNLLLVLGLAVFLGGLRFKTQVFNRHNAGLVTSLLTISVLGLLIPAMFDLASRSFAGERNPAGIDLSLSVATAVVLILIYIANIIFSLFTHKNVLSAHDEGHGEAHSGPAWSVPVAVGVLLAATVAVAFMSEFLVGSLEEATAALGLSEFFVGIILIPIIGNAAEHAAAIVFAMKNKMDLAVTIALGSTVQVALLVAPLLVLLSLLVGRPMDLVLHNPLELAAVVAGVVIANNIARDGESNWIEGLMLLGVYVILAFAFFFFPA
ncbi:Ca2+:H+ antiporter [Deinobacterium chartae]|uniref:Ca(2+)/H(+) antiporter n=1 Tax=Deinobacterium chartae TaxID=521158 RepID=A0A841I1X4_9DEIO|nr:calcium/proton exchanger [Deinobacterium chartae]MBB6098389.1 Ca2+:H+ antiporter [Deinobacterium chartae]